MIVLHLTNCPASLRGDLTRWLLEISAGVFVGNVSARVRDALWERACKDGKNARATLIYTAAGEQGLAFRTYGDVWEPIDFDGVQLILRPSVSRLAARQTPPSHGFSDAAKRRRAKRLNAPKPSYPESYVVLDVETTGLDTTLDAMIEIGALKVTAHEITDTFHSLLHTQKPLPPSIVALTGITDDMLRQEGVAPKCALKNLVAFIGNLPIVAHNANFDCSFIFRACIELGLPIRSTRTIDTLSLARRLLRDQSDFALESLAARLNIPQSAAHRSLADCSTTHHLFEKLIKIASPPSEE